MGSNKKRYQNLEIEGVAGQKKIDKIKKIFKRKIEIEESLEKEFELEIDVEPQKPFIQKQENIKENIQESSDNPYKDLQDLSDKIKPIKAKEEESDAKYKAYLASIRKDAPLKDKKKEAFMKKLKLERNVERAKDKVYSARKRTYYSWLSIVAFLTFSTVQFENLKLFLLGVSVFIFSGIYIFIRLRKK